MSVLRQKWIVLSVALFFLGFMALGEVQAKSRERRGGKGGSSGRGGGFSRKGPAGSGTIGRVPSMGRPSSLGPASGGSLHGRPGRPNRPDHKPNRPDFRPDRPDRPHRPDYRPDRPNRPDRPHYKPGRPGSRHDRWEDWRDYRDKRYRAWRDYRRDRWEDYRDYRRRAAIGAGIVAGAAIIGSVLSGSAFHDLGCTPTVITIGGISYYRCGPDWYTRHFSGGDVTYIVVHPPDGY